MSDDQDTKPEGEQITIRVRDQVSYEFNVVLGADHIIISYPTTS